MNLDTVKEKLAENKLDFAELPEIMRILVETANENDDFQEDYEKVIKSYQFQVIDKPENEWMWMKIEKGKFTKGTGKFVGKADLTFSMNAKLAADMLSGAIDSNSAFMKGDLKIDGNIKDGIMFQKILALFRDILDL